MFVSGCLQIDKISTIRYGCPDNFSLGKESVDFTSSFVDVEGVGAKAHYSKKQRQLSFVQGKQLYDLGARSHAEADAQELAKAIAIDILISAKFTH